jgi:hypothetical protein
MRNTENSQYVLFEYFNYQSTSKRSTINLYVFWKMNMYESGTATFHFEPFGLVEIKGSFYITGQISQFCINKISQCNDISWKAIPQDGRITIFWMKDTLQYFLFCPPRKVCLLTSKNYSHIDINSQVLLKPACLETRNEQVVLSGQRVLVKQHLL